MNSDTYQDKTVMKGWGACRNETHWHKTNEDTDYLTHEGDWNRWKQGIRDDVRPGTHEEGQVKPEMIGRLDFRNKTGSSRDKKTKQDKTSPLCDNGKWGLGQKRLSHLQVSTAGHQSGTKHSL